jgi:hypothetical protein
MKAEIQRRDRLFRLHLWDTAGSETFKYAFSRVAIFKLDDAIVLSRRISCDDCLRHHFRKVVPEGQILDQRAE